MAQQQQTTGPRVMTAPLEGIPLPDTDNLPDYERGFWEAAARHELSIQQCSDCEKFRHLPSPMCPYCHSLNSRWTRVSGRGRVYSYVIAHHPVHRALRENQQVPYNICLIELEEQEGLRILSNILHVAPEDIHIDMAVEVTFMATVDDPKLVLPLFTPAGKS